MGVSGRPSIRIRIVRRRLQAVAILLVAASAASATGIAEAARVQMSSTIDQNWRGPYDILVRPPGSRLGLERTGGLIEPNFLNFAAQGGISLSQLEAIRGIPNIEFAAPISVVGRLANTQASATVHVSSLPAEPTVYRLMVTTSTTDGLREVVVDQQTAEILLGPVDLSATESPLRSTLPVFSWSIEGVDFELRPLPPITSTLMAVDPEAEERLLGASAGFLSRLRTPGAISGRSVGTFDLDLIPAEYQLDSLVLRALRKTGDNDAAQRPVVPILVSDTLYSRLTATLSIRQIGDPLREFPSNSVWQDLVKQAPSLPETNVGTIELDLSRKLAPFQAPEITFLWPGSSPPSGQIIGRHVAPDFGASLEQRPSYAGYPGRLGSSQLTLEIEPMPGGIAPSTPPGSHTTLTRETPYRSLADVHLPLTEGFFSTGPDDRPFHLVPIGSFDLSELRLPDNPLNYVPLGAYAPPQTLLVADPNGKELGSIPLFPTLNPRGLVSVPPLAITDLDGASTLRGSRPIDAIRVRVADVESYSPESRRKVEEVASLIAAMGLDVDVVAGSSPRNVEIFVPEYFVDPPADLGFVSQPWTTLGAATHVERVLNRVDLLILMLAALSAALLLFAITKIDLVARRREAAVLESLGWSRLDASTWFLVLPAVGAVVVIAASIVTWWFTKGSLAGLIAALFMASAVTGVAIFSTFHAIGNGKHGGIAVAHTDAYSLAKLVGIGRTGSLALRLVAATPGSTVLSSATIACFSAGLVLSISVVLAATSGVGPTALGAALLAGNLPFEIVTLSVAAVSAAFAYVAIAHNQGGRIQEAALRSAGWSSIEVAKLRLGTQLITTVVGAAIAVAVTGAGSFAATGEMTILPLVGAVAASCGLAALGSITFRVE